MTSFQGTITRHAGADIAYDMTFGSPTRILMKITPSGELQFADHVHPKAVAEHLVAEFGRNYNSELALAEETARKSEAKAVRAERDAASWKDRCQLAERKLEDYRKAMQHAAKKEADALAEKAEAIGKQP
jgi:hypothetical protein